MFWVPLFDEVKINLPQEKQFIIKTENNSDSNIYIQSVKLNGENYNYSYIKHKDIMKGGELVFEWEVFQIKVLQMIKNLGQSLRCTKIFSIIFLLQFVISYL